MLEVLILFEHRRLVDVVVGGETVRVGIFCELPSVIMIVAADVDVEEHHVAIHVLFADEIFKVLLTWHEGLRQTGFFVPCVQRKIEDGRAGVAEAICNFGTQQSAIGANVLFWRRNRQFYGQLAAAAAVRRP